MTRFVWVLGLVALGCKGNDDAANARAVLRAFEDFQGASAADRPAALQALEAVACGDAPTCSDKGACLAYAKALVYAQTLVRKAHELGPVDAGGNGAATPKELAIIVAGADDATKVVESAEPRCREALDRLYTRARK